MSTNSYLIVGGGVFGASTAYHLSKKYPEASIVLLDRSPSYPCPLAASSDFNKIVRADYGSLFYCELALKAREVWTSDPLYQSLFHQTGMVVLDESDLGQKIIKNYEILRAYSECEIIGPDEIKTRYDGQFADADYTGVKDIFINPLSGWVEATLALRKVIEAAVSNGVRYVKGDVERLIFTDAGDCTGVATKDGRTLSADNVILSTGAGTAKLLADSAPDRQNLQVGDRITASAVVTGMINLNEEQMKRFKNAPIFIHGGKAQGRTTFTIYTIDEC